MHINIHTTIFKYNLQMQKIKTHLIKLQNYAMLRIMQNSAGYKSSITYFDIKEYMEGFHIIGNWKINVT